MYIPQRNVNSSAPRTTAPGTGVKSNLWEAFLLTNISLLHGSPRLLFGDPLTSLSQSLNELLRCDRDEKHGLFRDHRELLSTSSAAIPIPLCQVPHCICFQDLLNPRYRERILPRLPCFFPLVLLGGHWRWLSQQASDRRFSLNTSEFSQLRCTRHQPTAWTRIVRLYAATRNLRRVQRNWHGPRS